MIAGTRRAPARTASVFAALGHPARLALVSRLSDGSRCSIAQLSAGQPLTRQAVTKHLRVLEDASIIRHERAGRERLYALDPAPLDDIRRYVDRIASQWDARLARLKALVED